jgi:3-polyprenyl-4-hydroxybenzoate decarboxylase
VGVSREEEDILVERLGRLAWRSGRFIGGPSSASGGRLGARLAARLLSEDVHETELVLALRPDQALALARWVLTSLGDPIDETRLADDEHELRAVVGSGALNLNPAVVTLRLGATTATSTMIRVRGVAKEGLIRQRAGRKAAERVAMRLRASCQA